MKSGTRIAAALAVLSIALLAGCSSSETPETYETSDAIPRTSTPAQRDALILRELERQTELLRKINDKLDRQANTSVCGSRDASTQDSFVGGTTQGEKR